MKFARIIKIFFNIKIKKFRVLKLISSKNFSAPCPNWGATLSLIKHIGDMP